MNCEGKILENWVSIDFENCPECSGDLEVLTKSRRDNYFYDADMVSCKECGHSGQVVCDSETNLYLDI